MLLFDLLRNCCNRGNSKQELRNDSYRGMRWHSPIYILIAIIFLTGCGKQPDHVIAEVDGVNYSAVIDSDEKRLLLRME